MEGTGRHFILYSDTIFFFFSLPQHFRTECLHPLERLVYETTGLRSNGPITDLYFASLWFPNPCLGGKGIKDSAFSYFYFALFICLNFLMANADVKT